MSLNSPEDFLVNLFDNEPADPEQAMLWNMEQERELEKKTLQTNLGADAIDLYERIRQAHCNRLRQLNKKYPALVESAEEKFEKLHEDFV